MIIEWRLDVDCRCCWRCYHDGVHVVTLWSDGSYMRFDEARPS